jgi:hypothetical protein
LKVQTFLKKNNNNCEEERKSNEAEGIYAAYKDTDFFETNINITLK